MGVLMNADTQLLISWYPETLSQWAALFVAILPLLGGVVAFFKSALQWAAQQRMREWLRISDLAKILNNPWDHDGISEFSKWEQLLAIDELGTYRHQRAAVLVVLEDARALWPEHPQHIDRINKSIERLRSPWPLCRFVG